MTHPFQNSNPESKVWSAKKQTIRFSIMRSHDLSILSIFKELV